MDPFAQPWFWPAVAVIVGLPVVLLVLGEIHSNMVRRETPGAKIVLLIRNVLAPLGAILILFSQIPQETGAEVTWAKIAATAFGFVLILVLLNGLNLAVFVTAKRGTWRNRLPSIFVDIARAVLIVVTLAVLFGWIWGADIGGLFTALGISTIVIGLALQNAVGGVVAGLFLLFEQPFELGEYILTDWGKGRVVEINWRATHLDSGNGILVIPNGQLADSTFRNLSRASDPYEASTIVRFATRRRPCSTCSRRSATACRNSRPAPRPTQCRSTRPSTRSTSR
jgi:small-conductance mechanosensitive channel